jgi:deoxyribonuclease V
MKSNAPEIHRFSISNARKAQIGLSQKIIREDKLPRKPRLVAGVDVAYLNNLAIGAVAVLDYETLELLESQIAVCETKLPYIPTLLSFREIPPAVACIRKLKLSPDVFLVDGHGIAHPYGCGFASHLGLVIGKPTVGVAKSRLIGKLVKIGKNNFLVQNGEIIGSVVTTKEGSKQVIVSIGHKVSLETATKIVKHCVITNRIPEPLLQAHNIATREKKNRSSSANRHDP